MPLRFKLDWWNSFVCIFYVQSQTSSPFTHSFYFERLGWNKKKKSGRLQRHSLNYSDTFWWPIVWSGRTKLICCVAMQHSDGLCFVCPIIIIKMLWKYAKEYAKVASIAEKKGTNSDIWRLKRRKKLESLGIRIMSEAKWERTTETDEYTAFAKREQIMFLCWTNAY